MARSVEDPGTNKRGSSLTAETPQRFRELTSSRGFVGTARQMTQTRLAELLEMDQGNISKLEQRTDMYLSTLRSYVEAMGGALEIRAVFPDGDVKIDLLKKLSA